MKHLESLFALRGDLMDPWRKKAAEKCAFMQAPASKSDSFSYISFSDWYEKEYPKRIVLNEELDLPILPECKDSYLVFIDGEFNASLSKTPEGLIALPLELAMKSYGLFLQNRLQKSLKEETDFFALLNGACHGSGLFLYVAPGMRYQHPIQILHLSQQNVLSFPKIQIAAGKSAEIQLIQTASKGDTVSFVDCTLDEGARVSFYDVSLPSLYREQEGFVNLGSASQRKIDPNERGHCTSCKASEEGRFYAGVASPNSQNLPARGIDAWQMHSLRASLKRDSFFNMVSLTSGAKTVRSSFKVELTEENSEAKVCGLSLLSETSQSHIFGNVIHKAPFSRSEQQFKAALQGQSRSSFEGKIFVHPEALKTESYQRSQALLLSPDAACFARPNLEIFADDVKASHGATVTQLDKEALFYLQSRGLSFEEASSLLVKGFVGEMISRVPFPSLTAKFMGS